MQIKYLVLKKTQIQNLIHKDRNIAKALYPLTTILVLIIENLDNLKTLHLEKCKLMISKLQTRSL